MEWIAFAKSVSAASGAYENDYARRRKKVVAADYHAWGWKKANVAPGLAACRPKSVPRFWGPACSKQRLEARRAETISSGAL
jgi:hypothetical protein